VATATGITIEGQRSQFQGLFSEVFKVIFTVDTGNVAANSSDTTIISVPGMSQLTDVVLGWTHYHVDTEAHEMIETFHTWADELHFVQHNTSGGAVDPVSTTYGVIIGRLA
jgi:hypothetical protein